MNILVILPFILYVVQADSSDKQDVKTKATSPPLNTIQQSPKYEMFFQPIKYQQIVQPFHHQPQVQQISQKPQYVPLQLVQKPYYVPQTQPHAMIIIAQPTLLPQSLVYGNPTQQLLNYFHSNPQAKYQLLHGNYQQAQQPQPVQPTPTIMHPVVAAPTIGTYILTPAPQLQSIATHPFSLHQTAVHHAPQAPGLFQQAAPQAQALTQHQAPQAQALTQRQAPQAQALTQHQAPQAQALTQHQAPQAQALTQQYVPQAQALTQYSAPQAQALTQTAPPTAPATQYSPQTSQLGHIAQLAQLAAQQYVSSQLKTVPAIVTGFENFTPEQQAQIKAQLATHLGTNYHAVSNPVNQYSAKYVAQQDTTKNFVPSPQIKNNDQVTTVSSTDILKSRYVKGKN